VLCVHIVKRQLDIHHVTSLRGIVHQILNLELLRLTINHSSRRAHQVAAAFLTAATAAVCCCCAAVCLDLRLLLLLLLLWRASDEVDLCSTVQQQKQKQGTCACGGRGSLVRNMVLGEWPSTAVSYTVKIQTHLGTWPSM
jgi:hypothetical protein